MISASSSASASGRAPTACSAWHRAQRGGSQDQRQDPPGSQAAWWPASPPRQCHLSRRSTAITFTTPGISLIGVTASRSGCGIVGERIRATAKHTPAIQSSSDLAELDREQQQRPQRQAQVPAQLTQSAPPPQTSSQQAPRRGFHTVWTYTDSKSWSVYDVPRPPGATDALLQQVAVNGNRVGHRPRLHRRQGGRRPRRRSLERTAAGPDGGSCCSTLAASAPSAR